MAGTAGSRLQKCEFSICLMYLREPCAVPMRWHGTDYTRLRRLEWCSNMKTNKTTKTTWKKICARKRYPCDFRAYNFPGWFSNMNASNVSLVHWASTLEPESSAFPSRLSHIAHGYWYVEESLRLHQTSPAPPNDRPKWREETSSQVRLKERGSHV